MHSVFSYRWVAEHRKEAGRLPCSESTFTARRRVACATLGQGSPLQEALGHFSDAATMIQFMWQDDIRGVAVFIKECLEVYYGTDPDGGQASDQP